jgi:hypothetical protein
VAAHIIALHEVGSNNPDGVEIKAEEGRRTASPLDGIPFHPVLHGARHPGRRRCSCMLFCGGDLLRARDGRLLPRVQQLHAG